MNYLAHLMLSGDNLDMQVGGLLGDFVKGPLRGSYPESIEHGIRLHRQIDTLTDTLPQVSQLFTLFEAPWRRYAGIVVDIAFDHLLTLRWHQLNTQALPDFCAAFYQHLGRCHDLLPEAAQCFSERTTQIKWLESYGDPEIIPTILSRTGQRLRRPVALESAWPHVLEHFDLFEEAFDSTITELHAHSASYIREHSIS